MIAAIKWGALVGAGSYVLLTIGLTLLTPLFFGTSQADLNNPGPLSFACLGIFGLLFAFSAAGYFTGRDTLKVGWGAASAMLALVVYYVLGLIYTPDRSANSSSGTASQQSMAGQVLSAIAAAAIVLLIAAFMGWLGARPAIQQARKRLDQSLASRVQDTAPLSDTSQNST